MADRQINIHAERLMQAGEKIAQTLEKAATPPTVEWPAPVVSSPADIAALNVAASFQADIAALSAKLAPAGPEMRAATAYTAAMMTAADEENAARLAAVGEQARTGVDDTVVGDHSGNRAAVNPVDNHWKEGPDQPPQPPPPPAPKITSITPANTPLAPDPLPPGQTSLTDLNDTTPDWPHVITGDPKGWPDHPMIDGDPLPMKVPDGSRLLPTGVGRGDDGNVIGAFSNPKYDLGTDPGAFITKDTQLWNFTDPKHPVLIGTLADKSQASVYYNKDEHQWVVVGNDVSKDGLNNGSPRTVWTAPDTPGNSTWMHNLKSAGTIPDGGHRENQYYPLKGGGVMLLDAENKAGVSAYVASTTQGLTDPALKSVPIAVPRTFHPAVSPPMPPRAPVGSTWARGPVPYGATVTNDVINADGTETVTVRVSTWDKIVPPAGQTLPGDMKGDKNYFPHTYSYNVTIQH